MLYSGIYRAEREEWECAPPPCFLEFSRCFTVSRWKARTDISFSPLHTLYTALFHSAFAEITTIEPSFIVKKKYFKYFFFCQLRQKEKRRIMVCIPQRRRESSTPRARVELDTRKSISRRQDAHARYFPLPNIAIERSVHIHLGRLDLSQTSRAAHTHTRAWEPDMHTHTHATKENCLSGERKDSNGREFKFAALASSCTTHTTTTINIYRYQQAYPSNIHMPTFVNDTGLTPSSPYNDQMRALFPRVNNFRMRV